MRIITISIRYAFISPSQMITLSKKALNGKQLSNDYMLKGWVAVNRVPVIED